MQNWYAKAARKNYCFILHSHQMHFMDNISCFLLFCPTFHLHKLNILIEPSATNELFVVATHFRPIQLKFWANQVATSDWWNLSVCLSLGLSSGRGFWRKWNYLSILFRKSYFCEYKTFFFVFNLQQIRNAVLQLSQKWFLYSCAVCKVCVLFES